MKVGRNDPCPCGSGQKYKKCCGKNDNVLDFNSAQVNKEKDLFLNSFFTYLFENYQKELVDEYLEVVFDPPEDFSAAFEDEDFSLICQSFGFHKKTKNGLTPFQHFLHINSRNFRNSSLNFFKNYLPKYFSLYSVQGFDSNRLKLKDMLLQKEHEVKCEENFGDFKIGDIIFGQLSNLSGEPELFFDYLVMDNYAEELAAHFRHLFQEGQYEDMEGFLREKAFDLMKYTLKELNDYSDDEEFFDDDVIDEQTIYETQYILAMTWLNSSQSFLDNETPLKGFYLPNKKRKLLKYLKNPTSSDEFEKKALISCRDMIYEQLGLPPYKLKKINEYHWVDSVYKEIGELMTKAYQAFFTPLQISKGLQMWADFSALIKPKIVKPQVWVAVIEYALLNIEFMPYITQAQVAQVYNISPATLGNNYRRLINELNLREYATAKFPLKTQFEDIFSGEDAEELIDQAWDCSSFEKRVELAKRAIHADPYCIDGYVILGNEADNWQDALEYYQLGVQFAEKKWGPNFFKENTGYFWGLIETRPYMRAKRGLADALWALDKKQEAIKHYFEMLKLNPNDNQGIRYLLSSYLLAFGENQKLEELFKNYEDDMSIFFVYDNVLFSFKSKGDTEENKTKLLEAGKRNKYVVDFLLDRKKLPKEQPEYYSFGSKEEAAIYLELSKDNWRKTPGALDWVRKYAWLIS